MAYRSAIWGRWEADMIRQALRLAVIAAIVFAIISAVWDVAVEGEAMNPAYLVHLAFKVVLFAILVGILWFLYLYFWRRR